MESNTLIQELSAAIKRAADKYRKILETDGIKATGGMQEFTTEFELNDEKFVLYFNMPEYWKYVEYGRRPGKFPPINAIENWIKIKGIVPRAIKGKVPSTKTLAFLIARSIAKHGTIQRFGYGGEHGISKLVMDPEMDSIIKDIKLAIIMEVDRQITEEWNNTLSEFTK